MLKCSSFLTKKPMGLLAFRFGHASARSPPADRTARTRVATGWTSKSVPAATLNVEVATGADRPLVLRYMQEQSQVHEPIMRSTSPRREEFSTLFTGILDRSLDSGLSLLMLTDEGELVGIRMTSIATMPKEIPPKEFTILPDYKEGKLIDKEEAPSRKDKQVSVLCTVMYAAGPAFIPLPPEAPYFCMELIGIKPEYRADGLATRFCQELFKLAAARGIVVGEVLCTAKASQRVCSKLGFKVMLEMPYAKFLDGGEVCFKNTHDGSTGAQLMVGDLRALGYAH